MEGISRKNKMSMLFNCFFMLRRFIFSVVLLVATETSAFQIIALNKLSFVSLIYIFTVKPYKMASHNFLEAFNEGVVFIISYFALIFSDVNLDPQLKLDLAAPYCLVISI